MYVGVQKTVAFSNGYAASYQPRRELSEQCYFLLICRCDETLLKGMMLVSHHSLEQFEMINEVKKCEKMAGNYHLPCMIKRFNNLYASTLLHSAVPEELGVYWISR